jgi:MarR family transcriptional regulator, organic hydroperoxide resistance regulator
MRPASSLDDQVCFALYTAFRAVAALYRPLLDQLGLTYPQYLVMLVLWERGSSTMKELGAALQLDSGTLSPLLKRMEANGLVHRQRRRDDERSVDVTPTEKGQALRDAAHSVPQTLARSLDIPGDDLAALRDLLHRVTANALDRTVGMEN